MDNNVIEIQKQLQRAGYNYVAQSGNSNDALTRKAIEAMNTSRNYGAGVGKSALTQQGMDYLKQYASKPTTQPTDTTSQLKQAIATPQQPQAPTYTPAPDNSGMINQQYGSLVGALKAQIQQSINNKNQQIANKPQEYQPFKNENDVNRSNNMRSVLEQNANAGDNGGVGRQNTLEVDTNRDNVLNSLNQSQNNDINALKNDISDLVLTGNIQEAQFQAQKLQDLIADNKYVDNTNYDRSRDTISDNRYNDETAYNREMDTINRQDKISDKEWERSTNNPQYKAQLLDNEITALQLANLPSQLKAEANQIKLQLSQGQVDLDTAKEQLRQLKASYGKNTTSKSTSSTKATSTSYKTNADYQTDFAYAVSNGAAAEEQLKSRASEFIGKYGIDGYNALLKSARGE